MAVTTTISPGPRSTELAGLDEAIESHPIWTELRGPVKFKITAVNGSLSGPASDVVKASPLTLVAPTVHATAGQRQVTLSWAAVPNDDGYYWIWVADITAKQAMTRLPYPVANPSFAHTGLISGHQYEYKVGGSEGPYPGPLSIAVTATPT